MSDLAPFVAAAIRDKVVADLKAENEALTKTVDESRLVKVMSDYRSDDQGTVFQEGMLDDDDLVLPEPKFYSDGGHGHVWWLEFEYEGKQFPKCTLSQLLVATVTIGGVKLETLGRQSRVTSEMGCEGTGVVEVRLKVGCCQLWVEIQGWPGDQQRATYDVPAEEGWQCLLDVSRLAPEKTVIFHWLTIDARAVAGLFQRLPASTKSNEDEVEESSDEEDESDDDALGDN